VDSDAGGHRSVRAARHNRTNRVSPLVQQVIRTAQLATLLPDVATVTTRIRTVFFGFWPALLSISGLASCSSVFGAYPYLSCSYRPLLDLSSFMIGNMGPSSVYDRATADASPTLP
jgi:hypothetical protein